MKRRNLTLTIIAVTALTFAIITTSYGYWTDELKLSGEVSFEFRLPVVNDVEIPAEVPLPEEQPEKAQPESTQVDVPEEVPGAEEDAVPVMPDSTPVVKDMVGEDDQDKEPEVTLGTTNEEQTESTEAEGSTIDESAELQ